MSFIKYVVTNELAKELTTEMFNVEKLLVDTVHFLQVSGVHAMLFSSVRCLSPVRPFAHAALLDNQSTPNRTVTAKSYKDILSTKIFKMKTTNNNLHKVALDCLICTTCQILHTPKQ